MNWNLMKENMKLSVLMRIRKYLDFTGADAGFQKS